ncbi:nucleoporin NUP49/NSP49 [Aspergillus sclerotioniger CBS 115572]|uniref:Nucleoporin NUP49/NSP49 n=1 Tax=Aspergillus sclerotioniger CBS 115572 TaxID=1450535 RepID=A0A317WZC0_9EURO|nr:nucleoporin NUP49/NSP49 [Aspergillus sclerotioniger CBS 115572]PWY91726.1 nucleoporin NUP49/NSP49 [Aspergillus sclerotioniger CBS 115572]
MFAQKPSGTSTGLSINTGSANSLFGANTQTSTSTTPATTSTSGGLFGNLGNTAAQPKPAGGLFGNLGGTTQQSQPSGSNMFSGLGGQQQSNTTSSGGLFGGATATSSQPQSGGLFSGAGTTTNNTQGGNAGGGLFGNLGGTTTTQTQSKPLFGGLGSSTAAGGGLFGGANQTSAQQQQSQKPTLSLFGNQGTTVQQPTQPPAATGTTVIPGVKVDVSNILPTTKYESCADEIKAELERFDNFVLNQIKICNEVANMIPTIASQGETIPNDVEFVQGKLETMQHALENDAGDIDQLRNLVSRDAAEAQVAFRAIDTLKLPLQYQSSGGAGWWSQDQKVSDGQALRSTRKNTLALPDDVESDPSTATSVNGVPVNLVDYFSQRSEEMGVVLERYTRNLKEIEDHLHGVESTLERQIHDFVTSRSRDGPTAGTPKSIISDLATVLGDVEAGILGVASRLGGVTEQVQEVVLGPPSGS